MTARTGGCGRKFRHPDRTGVIGFDPLQARYGEAAQWAEAHPGEEAAGVRDRHDHVTEKDIIPFFYSPLISLLRVCFLLPYRHYRVNLSLAGFASLRDCRT
jgi:hypothetical protein